MNGLERFFRLQERGTTVATEVRAGVVRCLITACILFVNPQIVSPPLASAPVAFDAGRGG